MTCIYKHDCRRKTSYLGNGKPGYNGELCGGCLWWHGEQNTNAYTLVRGLSIDTDINAFPDLAQKSIFPDIGKIPFDLDLVDLFDMTTAMENQYCSNCGLAGVMKRYPSVDRFRYGHQYILFGFVCNCGHIKYYRYELCCPVDLTGLSTTSCPYEKSLSGRIGGDLAVSGYTAQQAGGYQDADRSPACSSDAPPYPT